MYLRILPVLLLPRDPDEEAALRAAEGADLDGEHSARVIVRVFAAFVVLLVVLFLAGCSSLAAAAEGARTARDVARGACALIGADSGDDAAAVLAEALRAITEANARDAAARGHEAEARVLLASAAAAMQAARTSHEGIARLAGAPVPCPAPAPVPAPPVALPPPAASVPIGAAPVSL